MELRSGVRRKGVAKKRSARRVFQLCSINLNLIHVLILMLQQTDEDGLTLVQLK